MLCLKILIFLTININLIIQTITNAMKMRELVCHDVSMYSIIIGVKIIDGRV